jgi:hypothetical protein
MKQHLLKFLLRFIPFTIILFSLQYFLSLTVFYTTEFYFSVLAIYAFHVSATLIIYICLLLVHKNSSDKTGFAFMGGSLLKMLAAVLFLLPIMLNSSANPFESILSFFIPYFLYLIFETFYAVKLINSK